MDCKKIMVIIILFLVICVSTGCSIKKDTVLDDNQKVNADWLLKKMDFQNNNVEQIEVTSDGKILILSAGKIYESEGEGFKEILLPESAAVFYIMENDNKQTLIVGSSRGVLYMKNLKENVWQKTALNAYTQPLNTIAVDLKIGTIYVGQSSKLGGGIWRSNDNGITWEKISDTTARCIVVHPEDSNVLYAVDRVTLISRNHGITWRKINTAANYGVLIHPLSSEKAYIVYPQGTVICEHSEVTVDRQSFNLPAPITCLELNFSRLGEWVVGSWDYPSGVGGLYYSSDSGKSWIRVDDLLNVRITDMRFAKNGDRLYIGTADGGLWVLNLGKYR